MAFFGDAPLGSADDPDREDGSIGYNGGGVAPQNEYNDIHAAQVVRASTIVPDEMIDDDEENALFAELYKKSEARLQALFEGKKEDISHVKSTPPEPEQEDDDVAMIDAAPEVAPPKTARRNLDDDDYDEYDEEEDEPAAAIERPALVNRHSGTLPSPSKSGSSPAGQGDRSPLKHTDKGKEPATSQEQPKSSEDARKKLEADKKAAEDAVKRSLNTIFYPLDNDRIAMLEQQKLEESEKQIDAEMGGNNTGGQGTNGHGSLSNANLGASSLTLKHLLARIDKKRNLVQASDGELRALINEVRKNRSKWASEDAVGQEELYEAAEKVLSELKAMTEYSAPFLTRVNKRDAPDYAIVIKQPMDLGTMTKKLKSFAYKSKKDFVDDLSLIWDNCLKYNADPSHPLRRNAIAMRKEAEKLVPLIPEITVRPRAEVEAEERRRQNGADDDAGDESDDEPIMSSRGRKAPKMGAKSSKSKPKPAEAREDGTPDIKPNMPINSLISNLVHENSDVAMDGSQNGFQTPVLGGTSTPGAPANGSQADMMDLDGPSLNGMSLGVALGAAAQDLHESEEYKIWKQVTKKDRALVAKERHKLFKGDKLNPDEPALLRTKAGMRRWTRQHRAAAEAESSADFVDGKNGDRNKSGETLAEEMEGSDEGPVLPDYYESLSAIPDLNPKQEWVEDAEGNVVDKGEIWHMVPRGFFTAPPGKLQERIDGNMRQIQETRKVCSKIGVVKQMQLQTQMYNNQFQKYNPEPFFEQDIPTHVQSEDGPVMAQWACRAALQRSVGKLCYHAGFEELQPSALDVITDIAADYFQKIARTFAIFSETPKILATGAALAAGQKYQSRYSREELVLHTLFENGMSIEELEAYVREDVDRYGTKLAVMHERMKAHLADLLRPALQTDVEGQPNIADGSDQFITGDFADDIGDDFFGFKELGLDKELGLSSLGVPMHLLQTRVHSAHNANMPGAAGGPAATTIFEALPPLPPVTKENINNQIGLVRNFFLAKLHANQDEPLVEDEDLPVKQRFPKPRLPPTGKISSPRKRPAKELGGMKKKKKVEIAEGGPVGGEKNVSPLKKGKRAALEKSSAIIDDDNEHAPLSPESIER